MAPIRWLKSLFVKPRVSTPRLEARELAANYEADLDKDINVNTTLKSLEQEIEKGNSAAAICAFGARLRMLRKLKDLDAESIAAMVGVERETVCAWELAKVAPMSSVVHKLCKILGCRAYQLLQRPALRAGDWDLIKDYTIDELKE